jgi:hypothetical protein
VKPTDVKPWHSVRFVKSGVDGMVWRAMGTVVGGQVTSAEAY